MGTHTHTHTAGMELPLRHTSKPDLLSLTSAMTNEKERGGQSRGRRSVAGLIVLLFRSNVGFQKSKHRDEAVISVFLKLQHVLELTAECVKTQSAGILHRVSESAGLGWGPRICISNEFRGNAEADGPRTIL